MTFTTKTLAQILSECTDAHQRAVRETRYECRGSVFVRSRGRFLALHSDKDVLPGYEGEAVPWRGTLREIRAAVAAAEAQGLTVTDATISCGLDTALSLADFADGAYDPWSGEWEISACHCRPAVVA